MGIKSISAYKFVAFAVLLQSFLEIFQQNLISVFHLPIEDTTVYRVVLTAIPLSIAIVITLFRKWKVFIVVYLISLFILLLNILVFPQNKTILLNNTLRFLLPVVIPSALCLTYIPSIKIVESVLYKISWFTAILAFFYVINFFSGKFVIDVYNMSFSYALLLPMLSLYSKKKPYSIIVSIVLFIIVLGIGSRGAAIIFIIYVLYDVTQSYAKFAIPALILIVLFFFVFPTLTQWFESIGISSRTLEFLTNKNIGYLSGRDNLYDRMIDVIWANPIKGIGLFGDRLYLDGTYVHNIILELYLNWGILVATMIIFFFMVKFIHVYKNSNKINRNILVKYLLASIAPLMFSGSYLIDYNLGIFIGVLFIISKNKQEDY